MPRIVNPRYEIDVTQARIDESRRRPANERSSPWSCPIGLAVAAALGLPAEYGEIDVGPDGISLAGATGRLRRASGPLPAVARGFLGRWDAGLPVGPIRFRLAIKTP